MGAGIRSPRTPRCVVAFLLSLSALPCFEACSIDNNGKPLKKHSRQEIVYMAPITVSGQTVSRNIATNTVEVDVNCVYKSNETMPFRITIAGGAIRNTCQSPSLEINNKTYIFNLKPSDNNEYEIFEPDVMNFGYWLASPSHKEEASNVCGAELRNMQGSVTYFDAYCPETRPNVACFRMESSKSAALTTNALLVSIITLLGYVFIS
ncbi:hypothetical protein CAPTEDRAFT_208493 [Capitella teleta]|uniref:ZP domain-containing protein n=1 Tax=Capitella teleta TaxID=283909 RepID=R7TZE0_CAPTE|nr:hypothetical protein CAPTEDRAFT_208493 [Capitella teleta]|eukprot:ELT99002.1 hypothetical protein CAPTEDRAFT_208493 [Capitella teleta]